jgi:hypothetical protein
MIYLVIALLLLCSVTTFYCIKFGIIILRVQDTLEDSLDVIDEKYLSMKKISETPLFYDSPEVRQVVNDIKATQSSLHKIALSLSSEFEIPKDLLEEEG